MSEGIAPMRIQEFARRTHVTVRTLHHYDRLGLLRPAGRTQSGYRMYGERELVRLQQITMLKFIGCSLKEIKAILSSSTSELGAILSLQREALERKRKVIDRALKAVDRAQKLFTQSGKADWEALQTIIEVTQMEQNKQWMKQYFTPEQLAVIESRKTPELIQQGKQGWAKLIPEVEEAAAKGVNPASDEAGKLAQRWNELIALFTGGDPGVQESLNCLYADKTNWPQSFKRPVSEAAGQFIHAAIKAHEMSCVS